jgi:hypothetical protein
VTAKLGPANLERFTDGSIAIDSDKVDNPGRLRAVALCLTNLRSTA